MAFLEPKMDDINEQLLADTISHCTKQYYFGMGKEVTLSADEFLTLLYTAVQWKNEKWKARAYDQIADFIQKSGAHGKTDVKL